MNIYLACSTENIVGFASKGLDNTGARLFVSDSSLDIDLHKLVDTDSECRLVLDIDHTDTSGTLEAVRQNGFSKELPLIVLTNSKHPTPEEPELPGHAVRVRKPFCIAALLQGCALAKRALKNLPPEALQVADILLYPMTGVAYRAGKPIKPHPREALLLEAFMRAPGNVLSREYILDNFFDYTARPRPNLVDVLVSRLRSRLHQGFSSPVLHTVRKQGYMFAP